MAILPCPCCGVVVTQPRTSRLTDEQAAGGYAMCVARGIGRDLLLSAYVETLNYTAPGMVEWLLDHPYAEPA